MPQLRPISRGDAARIRDFVDWAAADSENKTELRSLLDIFVYKSNNRMALDAHRQPHYLPRDTENLPFGWEWAPERTCGPYPHERTQDLP